MIEGCTDISLWNMNLEDEGNFALADAIMAQPEQIITKLDLGFNKIGPEAAQRFGKASARFVAAMACCLAVSFLCR